MTASGVAVHLCDPEDHDVPAGGERRALCGIGPVYFAPHPFAAADPLAVNAMCARCAVLAREYAPPGPPAPSEADPLLPLLRVAGLDEERAAAAAGIARAYLASELVSVLARAGVEAAGARRRTSERAAAIGRASSHPAPVVWGGITAGLAWARDVVHARRTWPPQPEPAAPPDGIDTPNTAGHDRARA